MERPQARRHQTACRAQGPPPLSGRRREQAPRGGIDQRTPKIRASECAASATGSATGEAPNLPEVPDPIPADQAIGGATAGAAAVIPHRKIATPRTADRPGAMARNEAKRASRRLGRTIWRQWRGDHRRNRAKTGCLASSTGPASGRPRLRQSDRRAPEVRVAIPNGFTALAVPVTGAANKLTGDRGSLPINVFLQPRRPAATHEATQPERTKGPAERDNPQRPSSQLATQGYGRPLTTVGLDESPRHASNGQGARSRLVGPAPSKRFAGVISGRPVGVPNCLRLACGQPA